MVSISISMNFSTSMISMLISLMTTITLGTPPPFLSGSPTAGGEGGAEGSAGAGAAEETGVSEETGATEETCDTGTWGWLMGKLGRECGGAELLGDGRNSVTVTVGAPEQAGRGRPRSTFMGTAMAEPTARAVARAEVKKCILSLGLEICEVDLEILY